MTAPVSPSVLRERPIGTPVTPQGIPGAPRAVYGVRVAVGPFLVLEREA